MAATSASAKANSETVAQATKTMNATASFTSNTVALRGKVEAGKRTQKKCCKS